MERKNLNKGFTLTEVLLATAILVFALCAILMTFVSCFVLMATAKNINTATNAALGLIEEIRATPFTQIKNNYDGLIFTVNNMPLNKGSVYVDDTNPELLEVAVSVCWRQGNRIFGEDANLNGVLDSGEDTNGNGLIDSPAALVTRISNR